MSQLHFEYNINDILKKINQAKILVVGDAMLDRYWFGEVKRISPEAPVPVVLVQKTEDRLGGCANVARNVSALGGQVSIISIVGDDEAGYSLKKLLKKQGIDDHVQFDSEISTTIKLRVVGRQQQLLRIDFEEKPSHEVLQSALNQFEKLVQTHDLIILSDYGKGGLTHIEKMIQLAHQYQKPVLIDPKGNDYSRYAGATLLTPNRSEFTEVAGTWTSEEELTEKALALRKQLNLNALLVTRSEEGMSLYTETESFHQETKAQEVFDVSGAGDTVIATLGLMLAIGLELKQAVEVANLAGGIVVGKLGTAIVEFNELFKTK